MLRWLLASLHLLAFGIGFAGIWARAQALDHAAEPTQLRRAIVADTWWGIAALLWLGTGLPRLLLGTEKPTAYYLANHLFWLKIGLFVLVFLLEVGPIITFTRWRGALRRGGSPDLHSAPRWAGTSRVQIGLLILLLFTATAMARGYAP